MTPKPTIKRTLKPLIVFLLAIMFEGYIWGCFPTPAVIPEELNGKFITSHPEYEDQFFELGSKLITLAFSGGKYKYYRVKRVKKEIVESRILYTLLCGNEDKGEEFNFAFFAYFAGEGIIHFKNKPQVVWKKQETKISYNDHSDSQFRH